MSLHRNTARVPRLLGVILSAVLAIAAACSLVIALEWTAVPTARAVNEPVQFSSAVYSANENSGAAVLTVTLAPASDVTITVDVSSTGGTASGLSDYAPVSSTLVFPIGATALTLTVPITDDGLYEGNETVNLALFNVVSGTLGAPATATLTIVEDETLPTVQLSNAAYSVNENGGPAVVTVTLSAPSGLPASVVLTSADGTASGLSDYAPISSTLNFAAGQTSVTATLVITDDSIYEGNETVGLRLSGATGAALGAPAAATLTIVDNETLPAASLTTAAQTVGESGPVTVTLSLSSASSQPASVPFTVGGTASGGGIDHNLAAGTFNVPAGSLSDSVVFTVTADTLDEDDETVIVTLGAPTGASLGATTVQTITITDDDTAPTLAINDSSVTEADTNVSAVFTASLSAASGRTITVNYTTAGNTATSGVDFLAASGTLTFTPGVTTQLITITVVGDDIYELSESYTVTLSAPTNATLADATGVGTITNDDTAPAFSISDSTVTEADVNTSAVFTVTLAGQTEVLATVNYATAGNTATSGVDFLAASGTLTFTPGTTTRTLTVTVVGDDIYELSESYTVTLSAPTNATLADATGVGTITNDDTAPAFSISDSTVTEADVNTSAVFTVTLAGATAVPATVNYATAGSTATSGVDFMAASGTLTFTPGATTQLITVTVVGDTVDEFDETFFITLTLPSQATLTDDTGVGTILDDDPLALMSINDVSVVEGDGSQTVSAVFTASLNLASAKPITATYSTVDGTAVSPADYSAATGSLFFSPGVTARPITITVAPDQLDEFDETFLVVLTNTVNAVLSDATGVGTILDNDPLPNLTISDVTVGEGNAGGVPAVFQVSLSAVSGRVVTATYATTDSLAAAPGDYAAATGLITFTPGVTTQFITVTVNGDTLDEFDETFFVNLTAAGNAAIVDGQGLGTILDDDPFPAISIGNVTVTEGNTGSIVASFALTLSAPSGRVVTVTYATADGTALAGLDYTAVAGVLTFTTGSVTQTIGVPVLGDVIDELDETFFVNLTAPVFATLADDQGLGTILDDDPTPTVSLTGDSTVAESAGVVPVTATLSAASGLTVTVPYTVGGTALGAGVDHNLAGGAIIIPAGNLTGVITFTVTDDPYDENNETVVITMGTPTNATPAPPTVRTITITDNDPTPTVSFTASAQSAAESVGTLPVTVTLSAVSGLTVTVPYTVGGSATGGGVDHNLADGSLIIPPLTLTRTIAFTVTADGLYETDETVIVNMGMPTNATRVAPFTHTATLVNDDPLPAIRFQAAEFSAAENAGSAPITVTLANPSVFTVTVNYTTSAGTATPGIDYLNTSGTLTFTPGVITQTFSVTILDDAGDPVDEPDKTVVLTLGSPNNQGTLGTPNPATLLIVDNDGFPTVRFAAASYNIGEGSGSLSADVILSNASEFTITVDITSSDYTASRLSDYVAISRTLVFAPGALLVNVTVPITDDNLYELNEVFTLTLSSPVNALLGTRSEAVVTILENDAPPQIAFSAPSYSRSENASPATLTVTLSRPSAFTTLVNYATSNLTAIAGSDYTARSGTLAFAPGATSQPVTVTLANDSIYEGNEAFQMTLSAPVSGTLGAPNPAVVIIVENDPPPTVQFSAAAYSRLENNGPAVITVTLTGATAVTATVNYATSNGTAQAGSDYTAASGTLTYAPGQTAQTFNVAILDNSAYEGNESLNLALSSPVSATLNAPSAATLTILENDPAPQLQLDSASYIVNETGGLVTITVNLSGATQVTATVGFATSNLTAQAGSDYTATLGLLAFAPGVTSRTVSVPIIDDAVYEGDEIFNFTLTGPISATLAGPNPAAISILENDPRPTIQFNAPDFAQGEDRGVAVVTVRLSGATAVTATVAYSATSGTALAGTDFITTTGVLTFTPGVTLMTFDVPLLNDADHEGYETISLQLSAPGGATLGSQSTALLTIAEDDPQPGCQVFYSANVPLAIPDASPAGVTSTLTIASPGQFLAGLSVRLESLTHTFVGDLRLDLIAPNGQVMSLVGGLGVGGDGDDFLYTVLRDGGTSFSAPSAQAPFIGVFQPFDNLANLDGIRTEGTWRLVVRDVVGGDLGSLNAWGLEMCGPAAPPLFNLYLPLVRR